MNTAHHLNKSQLQLAISTRAKRDTKLTDNWLSANGISNRDFIKSKTVLLQAQKRVGELLVQHAALLKPHKLQWLNDFASRCRSTRQHKCITIKECYLVMNISKDVNRLLFKQQRNKH